MLRYLSPPKRAVSTPITGGTAASVAKGEANSFDASDNRSERFTHVFTMLLNKDKAKNQVGVSEILARNNAAMSILFVKNPMLTLVEAEKVILMNFGGVSEPTSLSIDDEISQLFKPGEMGVYSLNAPLPRVVKDFIIRNEAKVKNLNNIKSKSRGAGNETHTTISSTSNDTGERSTPLGNAGVVKGEANSDGSSELSGYTVFLITDAKGQGATVEEIASQANSRQFGSNYLQLRKTSFFNTDGTPNSTIVLTLVLADGRFYNINDLLENPNIKREVVLLYTAAGDMGATCPFNELPQAVQSRIGLIFKANNLKRISSAKVGSTSPLKILGIGSIAALAMFVIVGGIALFATGGVVAGIGTSVAVVAPIIFKAAVAAVFVGLSPIAFAALVGGALALITLLLTLTVASFVIINNRRTSGYESIKDKHASGAGASGALSLLTTSPSTLTQIPPSPSATLGATTTSLAHNEPLAVAASFAGSTTSASPSGSPTQSL